MPRTLPHRILGGVRKPVAKKRKRGEECDACRASIISSQLLSRCSHGALLWRLAEQSIVELLSSRIFVVNEDSCQLVVACNWRVTVFLCKVSIMQPPPSTHFTFARRPLRADPDPAAKCNHARRQAVIATGCVTALENGLNVNAIRNAPSPTAQEPT